MSLQGIVKDCKLGVINYKLQFSRKYVSLRQVSQFNLVFKSHEWNKYQEKNKLKCKFSFYSDFMLQQKLCKAFRRHFPHIRAIFKTLCMASATKYSFKNINNLVMLVHAQL